MAFLSLCVHVCVMYIYLWIRGGLKKGTEVSDDLRIPVYSLEITCCLQHTHTHTHNTYTIT